MTINKIGARPLTNAELLLIMPTYDKILEQIKQIRLSANVKDQDIPKTNNIGILGKRGSGKTSILKTLEAELKTENQNIVLPMIIPENMSPSMNLMAAILGLFSEQVEKIVEEEKNIMINVGIKNLLKFAMSIII